MIKLDKATAIILGDALWNSDQGTWATRPDEEEIIAEAIRLGYLTPNHHLLTDKGTEFLIKYDENER